MSIILSTQQTNEQLTEAVSFLCDENADLIQSMPLEELSSGELFTLANTLLKRIDKSVEVQQLLPPTGLKEIEEAYDVSVTLMYKSLTSIKLMLIQRLQSCELTGADMTKYYAFNGTLSDALVRRLVKQADVAPEIQLIFE